MTGYEDRVYTSVKIRDRVVGTGQGREDHIMTFDASNRRRESDARRRIAEAGGIVDSEKECGPGGWRRIVRWHTEAGE